MFINEIKFETGETPGLCQQDSKEYDNLEGYYVKMSYSDDLFSIIVYNMELLDEKKYEFEIDIQNLFEKFQILKKFRTIKKIFEFFNDLIEKNNYNIIPDEKSIKFYFLLNQHDSNKEDDRICFTLVVDKKSDKNEYINFLCKSIRKSRIHYPVQEESKREKKEINSFDTNDKERTVIKNMDSTNEGNIRFKLC